MSTPREELKIDEAPSVFHLSDHPSPESYEDSVAVERCPVCRSGRHPLYCAECVRNEELSHRNLSFKRWVCTCVLKVIIILHQHDDEDDDESDTSVFNSRPLCHETPFQTSFLLYSFPLHSSMVSYLVSRSHSQWVDHHASKRFAPLTQHQEAISCTIFGEVYSWTGTTTYNPVGLHTLTPCSEPYMPSLTVLRMECGSFINSHTQKISWQKTLRWRWGVIMTELRR